MLTAQQVPSPEGRQSSPKTQLTGSGLAVPQAERTAVRHPDGSVRGHSPPTTLGPLALAAFLVPGRATQKGCLRGRCRDLPQPTKEPLHPSFPLRGVHRRGSIRNLYLVSEPPDQSVASSRGNTSRP